APLQRRSRLLVLTPPEPHDRRGGRERDRGAHGDEKGRSRDADPVPRIQQCRGPVAPGAEQRHEEGEAGREHRRPAQPQRLPATAAKDQQVERPYGHRAEGPEHYKYASRWTSAFLWI